MAGKSGKMVGHLGGTLADHGLAGRPLMPASGATLPRGVDVEFRWSAANHCADAGGAEYSLRFYGPEMTVPVFSTPFAAGTSIRVKADELRRAAAPDGGVIWAVVARDTTPPATGEFHGPMVTARLQARAKPLVADMADEPATAPALGRGDAAADRCHVSGGSPRRQPTPLRMLAGRGLPT